MRVLQAWLIRFCWQYYIYGRSSGYNTISAVQLRLQCLKVPGLSEANVCPGEIRVVNHVSKFTARNGATEVSHFRVASAKV